MDTLSDSPRRSFWIFVSAVAAIAAAFIAPAAGYVSRLHLTMSAAAGIYSCFLLLMIYIVAPAIAASRTALETLIAGRHKAVIVLAMLIVPYLLYAVGTNDFRWLALARLVSIAAPPILLYSLLPVRQQAQFNWQDLIVAIWLVLIVLFHQFSGIWNVPVNLDFMARLFVTALGALCWVYLRPVPDLGYRFEITRTVLMATVFNFVYFAAIAIPFGFLLGFTAWNPRWRGSGDFLIAYLEIFLFIALLEEIFFRGFLQNLLAKSLHSWWRGQLVASCIFGLFHILHAPFPDWRYVILASIAGWFYGSAYRARGSLLSSALLHAMVDTVWRTFLTKS